MTLLSLLMSRLAALRENDEGGWSVVEVLLVVILVILLLSLFGGVNLDVD